MRAVTGRGAGTPDGKAEGARRVCCAAQQAHQVPGDGGVVEGLQRRMVSAPAPAATTAGVWARCEQAAAAGAQGRPK